MQQREGFVDFNHHKTWYSVYGDLDSGNTPLLVLHGGPGYTHNHLQNLSELSQQGIPVVLYDQVGCGKSDRPDNPSLWTIELFIDELRTVRESLELENIHLLGHSWGGTLAAEYLFTQPEGVQKLVLSSPLLDTTLWVEEADKLKDQLEPNVAATMRKHELAGTTDTQEYKDAYKVFTKHFLCRVEPYPEFMRLSDEGNGQQVYETMWGPSESLAAGTLKGWSALSRLGQITIPTLLLSGKYDEATPRQMELAQKGIPGSEWIIFENSSHTTNLEEPEKYLKTVGEFLGSSPSR